MNSSEDNLSTGIEHTKAEIGAEHGYDVRSLFAHLEQLPPRKENPPSKQEARPIPQLISEPAA